MLALGSVIYCRFPFDEGGSKNRYGLVIEVGPEERVGRSRYVRVAYASSKEVTRGGCLKGEFVLDQPGELRKAGLDRPTRFDLGRVRTLSYDQVLEVTGEINLRHPEIIRAAKSL
ncbi:hypothetical protein SAMN05660831_00099 [Thiohalospira halophila DSM 15071]|uniref:PemK-like, MazF-like toxin of type II toxin-antitoxin system n=1 Tax=Thiohalospira halophila DSM 15071 TaxID=1123397 RepID=A0A1I1N483_9GAMM|nr:hypothetical protein [Thiohalospira halophila]SFC92429.1 hypothetical protein SAMN05660831_00099 [Thiohalospira halophila DSM 15071]